MAPVDPPQMGGEGKTLEADETYIGRAGSHDPDSWIFDNTKGWVRKYSDEKMNVMTLVERGGSARSFHIGTMNSRTAYEIFVLHSMVRQLA